MDRLQAIRWSELPVAIADRIAGGIPDSEEDGVMWGTQIGEVGPSTNVERFFDSAKTWRPEDRPLSDFCPPPVGSCEPRSTRRPIRSRTKKRIWSVTVT